MVGPVLVAAMKIRCAPCFVAASGRKKCNGEKDRATKTSHPRRKRHVRNINVLEEQAKIFQQHFAVFPAINKTFFMVHVSSQKDSGNTHVAPAMVPSLSGDSN